MVDTTSHTSKVATRALVSISLLLSILLKMTMLFTVTGYDSYSFIIHDSM